MAYLVTDSGMGGAEVEVCHLAEEFRRRRWGVSVISMLPLEPPISELAAGGVQTHSLEMRQGIADPRAVVRLGRLLRRWPPDVVHAHMVHANLLARVARLIAPVPRVISTIHSENEGGQWRYAAYRLTNRLSEVTTVVSRAALDSSIGRGAAPDGSIVLVPNGLNTAPYASDPIVRARTRAALQLGERFTWLAVGRLTEAKGYPDMVDAFARVLGEHPDALLLIAGEGQLENQIRNRIRDTGIEGSVRMLGLRSDVAALMQAADGFLMTSHWEGLPMVLLEAGAGGLPIVATDAGGTRDAVLDGVSGHLTPAAIPRRPRRGDQQSHAYAGRGATEDGRRGARACATQLRDRVRRGHLGAAVPGPGTRRARAQLTPVAASSGRSGHSGRQSPTSAATTTITVNADVCTDNGGWRKNDPAA